MNFDGKMKLRVDFLKGSLAVNFEFWVLTESYVKSWFFLQDFDRKYWILTEKWNEKLLFDGIFDRKYWILTFKWNEKLIYWRIWVWSVSFKKRIFRQFSSQIQLEKFDFNFKTKIFQSRTFTYFCFVTSKFWFYKWIAKLAVRVTRLRFIFFAICQIVPILIYWLYRFKK